MRVPYRKVVTRKYHRYLVTAMYDIAGYRSYRYLKTTRFVSRARRVARSSTGWYPCVEIWDTWEMTEGEKSDLFAGLKE